ncbi:Subtilase family protein [Micromonospora eburnea]|uniref:Subtilase family protein n=2 Tax=Micromonospora eburnea TaxID=227316 RepID=A0A1C6TYU5_9ACTN|nr:Subtilase family protein [Micromonospora eburnea]
MIVEFSAAPTIAAAPRHGSLDAQAGDRLRQAREAVSGAERGVTEAARRVHIKLDHRRSYHVLLPGMAVRVPANQVDALRRLPGVKAVHDVTRFHVRTVDSVPLIGAPEVWRRTDPAGRPARGHGVTVAVIDTGVDYRHPALGGGFGPGHRVVGGYDFANDDTDPMDDNGHGTHVAGIIAGTGAGGDMAVTGVAPDATLTAYKVLNEYGWGDTEDIIAALEAAVDPANPYRADVVNMSLGATGDGTDPVGLAATRAVRAGVVVVAAAGNDGPGERTVDTPAAADGVLAVGASTSGLRLPTLDLASPRKERVQTYRSEVSANPPVRPVKADLIDIGEGAPADYARAGDVRGKALLMARPPYHSPFDDLDRYVEAERRGALAVIGYGGVPGPSAAAGELAVEASTTLGTGNDARLDRLVVLDVGDEGQYQQLRTLLDAGRVRVTVSGEDATDRIASFSSRGPDPRWRLKPEIVAPGVEILSSVPTALWEPGVYRFSGTSMAAPHVAGAAALLRQLWPDASAERITAALIGSATAVPDAGPGVAGAGRLNIPAALSATVTADPPALSFGLADMSPGGVQAADTVTLRNDGDRPARLRLGIVPGPGSPGQVRVEPAQVTVPAGGSASVTVRVTADAPEQGSGDVTGWLTVDAPNKSSDLRVPYLLPIRTPQMYVSPDPSDGHSELFLYTLEPAAAPPTVVLRSPNGHETTVTVRNDHDLWWRAPVSAEAPGVHTLTATVQTVAGPRLIGRTSFEVADPSGSGRWELIGPHSTGGQLATTPADPNRLAVAVSSDEAGVWLTTDRARTWRYARITPVAGGDPTVLIDPKRPDRMWAAVNSAFDPSYQGKVLRTDDAGRTWRTLPFPDTRIDAFAQDPSGAVLAALTGATAWTSRDGGQTWASTAAPWTGGVSGVAFAGDDLYVAAENGVWRWVVGSSGAPTLVRPASDYFTAPRDVAVAGDTVAVAQRDNTIWGTTDGGQTWQHLLTIDDWFSALSGVGDTLLVDAFSQTQLSRDRGRTWTEVKEPVDGITFDLAQWPGDEKTLLFGMEGGVYATGDARNYERVGVPGQSADRMVLAGDKLLVGTPADVYRTTLPGDPGRLEWGASGGESRIGQSVRGLAVSPTDPRTVWKLYLNGYLGTRLTRSDDAGGTWSEVLLNDLTPLGLLVHPADARQIVIPYYDIASSGLFVSRDGGTTWKKIDHGARYTAIAGDPRDPKRLWLGDRAGLWRSDDGGATRVKVLDGPVTALHVDGKTVVAGGDRIRVSTDRGRNFVDARTLGTGAHGLPVRVSQVTEADGVLYAGTTGYSAAGLLQGGRGVLRSADGGRTWVNIGAGLPDPSVQSVVASPDGRWLFAGTRSGGVYRLPIGR